MSQLALKIIREEHAALSAMLRSLALMIERGPGEQAERFFDVLRAMLFYIDEFPERMHHPKESDLLFPRLVRVAPELLGVVSRLEAEHAIGQDRVRGLQHLLLAWELLGESRRPEFTEAAQAYLLFICRTCRLKSSSCCRWLKACWTTRIGPRSMPPLVRTTTLWPPVCVIRATTGCSAVLC